MSGEDRGETGTDMTEIITNGNRARRTFDEFFSEYTLTDYERRELVFFLAAYRYRKTIETLL